MNIYKVWQDDVNDFDTYDSMVVIDESEEKARMVDPSSCSPYYDSSYSRYFTLNEKGLFSDPGYDWTSDPKKVHVELIGEAVEGSKPCIVVASFNAG